MNLPPRAGGPIKAIGKRILLIGQERHRIWWALLILLLITGAAWIWSAVIRSGTTISENIPGVQPGNLAPDFTLQTLDGNTITLSDLRGRPVLINIWASWCGPCKYEMPAIQRVYEVFRDREFIVLGVNLTKQDNLTAVIQFVEEHDLAFPILLDSEGLVANTYKLRGLPVSFFIDREGVVQSVVIGGPMPEEVLRTRVERLID